MASVSVPTFTKPAKAEIATIVGWIVKRVGVRCDVDMREAKSGEKQEAKVVSRVPWLL